MKITSKAIAPWIALMVALLCGLNKKAVGQGFNYKDALSKSIIFLECQRSGKLPPTNRVPWRGDSGLEDGKLANVDLVGGYYDAGDNVKYGLPMAFTVTTLAWGAIFYESQLQAAGELQHVRDAIRWGTDYFLKCSSRRNRLYVQVGDPLVDHQCWIRPENMQSERPVLQIDEHKPGTEIAAETAAAMAAASIVFRKTDQPYSRRLLNKAKSLFRFAGSYKGTFDGECPFYCSFSGFNDEMQWAATWLYKATKNQTYYHYIEDQSIDATISEFNWDLKYAGSQILLTELYFQGQQTLDEYKKMADSYICSVLPGSPYAQAPFTPGGLLYMRDGANLQYATAAAFAFSVYGDLLARYNQQVICGGKQFGSADLLAFAKKQMDYILGANPQQRSYMVGFGKNFPQQPHHRGASNPILSKSEVVTCAKTFMDYFTKNAPNPNELTGAIVGGPDKSDNFEDRRHIGNMEEPCTYINSLAIGALARLTSSS
ncbi:endoglucanase 16-like [Chenopodium quinoa]|uniref:endoglucanase 16-like n=1 Tax=Chenopodium quinoa TaxID=63459 RepID=UPI000B78FE09|nr:endoglucanase 16-like [Chenopodium quinoa]